jgi:hypothetical protein
MQADEKIKGKAALDKAHQGLWVQDEQRFDSTISTIYGVEIDEARDIHKDYHANRLFSLVLASAAREGISKEVCSERLHYIDLEEISFKVATGSLSEAAAVDTLLKKLETVTDNHISRDRYFNFYG